MWKHTHKQSQGNETEEKGFRKRKVFKGYAYAKSTMTTAYCVCGGRGGEGGGGSKSGS